MTGEDTEVLARCRTGAQCGRPAVTRRAVGGGSAYVSTRLGVEGLAALLPRLLEPAGVGSELPAVARGAVEPVVRRGPGGRFVFLVNRTEQAVPVPGGHRCRGGAGADVRRSCGGAALRDRTARSGHPGPFRVAASRGTRP
ncbi:hypothetical protein GCM10020256_74180 [Streptomyces thermocoprophilus]